MAAKKGSENVRVAVRCRPLSEKEINDQHLAIVNTNSKIGEIAITNPKMDVNEPPKIFTFDSVYGQDSIQEEIYLDSGYPIVESVLEGSTNTAVTGVINQM